METRASYLLVGSFVLAIMAASVVFVVWLTGATPEKFVRYYMYFEGSVTGLQVGSQVRFRGIPVGEVVEINVVTEEKEDVQDLDIQIEVVADIREDTPIRESTVAVLEVQGITGVSYIQLTSEPGPSKPLKPREKDKKLVIPTRPGQLEKIFQNFPELLAELTALAIQGKKLLNDDNLKSLSNSISNIEHITDVVGQDTEALRSMISRGEELFREATVVLKQVQPTLDQVTAALDRGGEAADAVRDAANEMQTMIETNQQPLADFAASGLYELSQFLVEARQLVAALSRISKKLEDDPARFLFGDSQKGYEAR